MNVTDILEEVSAQPYKSKEAIAEAEQQIKDHYKGLLPEKHYHRCKEGWFEYYLADDITKALEEDTDNETKKTKEE